MDVVRGGHYDHILCVGDQAFPIAALIAAVHKELIAAGHGAGPKYAHPFHLPPFFRTGCPYGPEILALAERNEIEPIPVPDDMDTAVLPHDGMYTVWDTQKAWPEVFGCDFHLNYPNGKFAR